jgi:hypothetical protein
MSPDDFGLKWGLLLTTRLDLLPNNTKSNKASQISLPDMEDALEMIVVYKIGKATNIAVGIYCSECFDGPYQNRCSKSTDFDS